VFGTKVSPLQVALPLQENDYNFVNLEMQMMTSNEVSTSPCSGQKILTTT